MTFALLAVLGSGLEQDVSTFYLHAAYPQAAGRNIVNVILVDFRALDTLGEVAVVLIAGIAALAALRAGREMKK